MHGTLDKYQTVTIRPANFGYHRIRSITSSQLIYILIELEKLAWHISRSPVVVHALATALFVLFLLHIFGITIHLTCLKKRRKNINRKTLGKRASKPKETGCSNPSNRKSKKKIRPRSIGLLSATQISIVVLYLHTPKGPVFRDLQSNLRFR